MSTTQNGMTIINMLSKLYGALGRGELTGDEAERIHWMLLNSGEEVREVIGRVLDKLAVLAIDMKKGKFPASDFEKLKRPLLVMVGPVLPQPPPDLAQPSSAGQPTIRLRPPRIARCHYLIATAALGGGLSTNTLQDLQASLDRHGAEGWELAACHHLDGQLLLIFKRSDG